MSTEVVYKLPSGASADVLGRRGQALDQLMLAGLDVPRTMAVPIHIIDRLRGPAATHAAGLPSEVQAAIATFVDEVGPVIVRTSAVDDAQAPIESEALRDVQSVLAVMADIRAQHPDQRLAMLIQRVVVGECRGVCALTDDDGVAIDVWHRAEEAQEGGGPARNGRGFAQRSTPERTECSRAIVRAAGIDWLQRNGDTLDDDKAAAIAIAARAAADALFEHGPLQLVWTIGGGRVWLIDAVARPRVRLEPGARAEGPRVIWTDVDTQELWPDVATPMTREVAHAWVRALAMPFLADTAPVRDFIDVVDGRIYANVNAVVGFFHSLPVLRRQTPAKLGSFIFAAGSSLGPQTALVKEDLGPPRFSPWIAFTAAWRMARLLWRARRLDGTEVIEACARIHNDNDGLATVELTTLDNPELVEHLDRLIIAPFGSEPDATVAGRALGVGLLCARALPHLTRSWLADEDQSLALRLLSGLPATETAEAAIALKRLATLAVGLAVIELINPDDYQATRARLEDDLEGKRFLQAFSGFMRRFGHHTRGECDVALPRWAEQPEYVLRLVKSAAGFIDHPLPTANVGDVQGGRTALIQELGDRLSGMRRRVFLGVASRIAPYARLRDQHQSESMRRIFLARTALLETGLRLQRMDIVDDPNDVFFLVLEEVRAALLGVLDPAWDLRSRVLERRAQSDGHRQHAPPPQVVVGPRRDGPESLDVRLQAGDEPHALRGVGASPGVVEGMIRVITANDNQHTILPGEVLVAPFTDAGWAPYFVHAAAIIIDSGDALSSGSTLAREMGIPAVVQVGGASRRLRTGQRVRVDGLRGEVMVLADIPQAAHDDPAQAA